MRENKSSTQAVEVWGKMKMKIYHTHLEFILALPFPVLLGRIGMTGDGIGSGISSFIADRSGNLLISMPITLSGEEEGTKLSGVSLSSPDS